MRPALLIGFACLALQGCEDANPSASDGGHPLDAGPTDGGQPDGGFDAGVDGGQDMGSDAGEDQGTDAGASDGGLEAGRLAVIRAGMALEPGARIHFGRILLESNGAAFGVWALNTGDFPLQLEAPVLEGDPGAFSLEPAEGALLAATSSKSYTIRFTPTETSTHSARLRFGTNDPEQPSFELELVGVGVSRDELPADTNGDWGATDYVAYDTREARIVVRVGDIDNLGFGWPRDFDPFSGRSTPAHTYPWTPDPSDPPGTDRIMVVSSYVGRPPRGRDGYTNRTTRPDNQPAPVTLSFDLRGSRPYGAVLQIFVDDFQAPVYGSSFQARFDGVRVPVLEAVLNRLRQTGPIGKLITLPVPAEQLPLLDDGQLTIAIDDPTTGAGDGFALDFVKLFIDVYGFSNVGDIAGSVNDRDSGLPIRTATVSASGVVRGVTDILGAYQLSDVPAGFVFLRAEAEGYQSEEILLDLQSGGALTHDFDLQASP